MTGVIKNINCQFILSDFCQVMRNLRDKFWPIIWLQVGWELPLQNDTSEEKVSHSRYLFIGGGEGIYPIEPVNNGSCWWGQQMSEICLRIFRRQVDVRLVHRKRRRLDGCLWEVH